MTLTHFNGRRLLNIDQVAVKLGTSRATFDLHRGKLELAGFPVPCLDQDEFGGRRWDEKAIDLWLDARIPTALRDYGKTIKDHLPPTHEIEAKLQQRARDLRL